MHDFSSPAFVFVGCIVYRSTEPIFSGCSINMACALHQAVSRFSLFLSSLGWFA
jgi:hypothetical protein